MTSLNPKLAAPLYKALRGQCASWRPESQHFTEQAAGLWMGVIYQAINDLCHANSRIQDKRSAAADALDFLVTSAPKRLTPIAETLGLNQPWVTERVRRALNGGAA